MTHVRPHIPASSASVPPPSLTRRKTTKKPQAKTKTSARPAPPPIHLPDPSQSDPLPPNLLRNQPGLLGTAGVVAGVRPAHLPARSAPARSAPPVQGATSSNPIFVDDDVRPPPVSRFKRLPRVNVDPSQLPPPSNQDIVSTLIRQRDIFPVLEHILKFIAAQTPPSSRSNFSRSQSRCSSDSRSHTPSDEPKKRRKLRQVPAGAALWDVPFPFNEGEGPDTYRDDWEKDRGKKLIADLVAVIKGAARKAAVQNHLDKTQEEKRQAQEEQRKIPTEAELASIGKHYRVDTLFYGPATKSSEPEVLADASYANRPSVTPSFDPSHPPSPPQASVASAPSIPTDPPSQSTPFDQLISSLLSASSNEQLSMASDNSTPDAFFDPSSPLDPGLFDSWMDIFQTFPVPPEGFTPDFKADDYHIDPRETFLTMPESMRDTQSPPMPFDFSSDVAHAFPEPASSHPTYSNPTFEDLMIDPALLSLSTSTSALPGPSASGSMSHFSDSGCPSLVGSPIPSVSSSSFGPMTPTEMGWNGDAESGVYSPVQDPVVSSAEGSTLGKGKGKKRDFSDMSEWTDAEKEALYFLEVLSQSKTRPKGKGKSKADRDSSQDSSQDAPGRDEGKESDVQFSKVPTVPIVGALAKAEVLKRAKERREELSREIERTRIALWETTIEGGVLAGLVQHYGKGCSEV
ncbi:hypothetical protein B0H15DRAFT_942175 [Mycena belliarum]|uniref:Uncharacterized protein n=1 Tax=Mycena belliarum TaxID=1033014 RepID=A0AAD6UIM4_9AGAR|nr:hypothetical protein B0H15DRAFT_942175 [Mycena belliae]